MKANNQEIYSVKPNVIEAKNKQRIKVDNILPIKEIEMKKSAKLGKKRISLEKTSFI